MKDPNCECWSWARPASSLLTSHHPKCSKYDLEAELVPIIRDLVKGIEVWASDEDGVHYKCWDAYEKAKYLIGEPIKVKE